MNVPVTPSREVGYMLHEAQTPNLLIFIELDAGEHNKQSTQKLKQSIDLILPDDYSPLISSLISRATTQKNQR